MKFLVSIFLLGTMSSLWANQSNFEETLANCNEQAVEQVEAEFKKKFGDVDVWLKSGFLVNFNSYKGTVIAQDKATSFEYLVEVSATATPGAPAPLKKACIKLNFDLLDKSYSLGMGTSKLKRIFAQ